MPGKADFGKLTTPDYGSYFPGSKEYRAWDEGWRARYALQAAGTNPHPAGSAENQAWADGWSSADGNSAGMQRMPHVSGVPGALP